MSEAKFKVGVERREMGRRADEPALRGGKLGGQIRGLVLEVEIGVTTLLYMARRASRRIVPGPWKGAASNVASSPSAGYWA